MKGLFKLTTAALALVTFASCSNDDLAGSQAVNTPSNNVLTLNVENMGEDIVAGTRTAYIGENNTRVWQNTDKFTVYDEELHKYDFYTYKESSNAFELSSKKDLSEPKFVLFPSKGENEGVQTTTWDKDTESTYASILIPSYISYKEIKDSNPTAYVSNLPMWGTATKAEDYETSGNITADVSFMTAILKVSLTNIQKHAAAITVFAYEDIAGKTPKMISGEATAQLSKNGQVLSKDEAALATPKTGYNYITVDIPEASALTNKTVVYIPLIAGHYGQIKVKYYTSTEVGNGDNCDATKGTVINVSSTKGKDYTYVDKTFERAHTYAGAKKEWQVAAANVNQLNDALKTVASQSGNVEFEVADAETAVGTGTTDPGNTLTIPAMSCDDITIKVNKFTNNNTLYVEGAEFTKKVILNVAQINGTMEINLPNAEVVLAGVYKNASSAYQGITIRDAKKITFGDGETVTDLSISTIESEVGDVAVAEKAKTGGITLKEDHRTSSLTIDGESGILTVNGATNTPAVAVKVNEKGKAGNITINGEANASTVEVAGIAGDITTTIGKVIISGDPCYTTANYSKVANVTTSGGDVEISLTEGKEGRAIATKLTFNKSANLALNNGYIAAIDVKGGTATAKTIVKVTNGTGGWTSLGTVTKTDANNLLYITNASVWNGKLVGAGVPDPATGDTWTKAAVQAAYTTLAPANIYTATEFVQVYAGKEATTHAICNSINLGGETAITPATALKGVMGGTAEYNETETLPTISGIKIATAPTATAEESAGFGFFKCADGSSEVRISNLTFDGISVDIAEGTKTTSYTPSNLWNVGGLIGLVKSSATGAVNIRNVTINNATVKAAGLSARVAGVIGYINGGSAVTFENVKVASTAITGYKRLGGIVGEIADGKKATFTKSGETTAPIYNSVSGLTFTQNTDPTKTACDAELAEVGDFIGYTTNKTAANVVINVVAIPTAPAYTISNASAVSALAKWPIASGSGVQMKDIVKGQYIIGFSNNATTTVANFSVAGAAAVTYQAQGVLTAAPASTVKYLDYVKNF